MRDARSAEQRNTLMPAYAQQRPMIPLSSRREADRLLYEPIERCGHCMLMWPSTDMRDEVHVDGSTRVCPLGSSPTADVRFMANVQEQIAAAAERYIPMPRISLAAVERPLPATVTSVEDIAGALVRQTAPHRVLRDAVGLLHLIGINFPLSDAACLALIAFPAGLATGVGAVVNAEGTLIVLSFTVAALAAVGTYSINFNGATLKNVLLVR